ncbi:MAG: adenosylmethionine decarboxylase [Candidatus Micrarchaeia archaeon]
MGVLRSVKMAQKMVLGRHIIAEIKVGDAAILNDDKRLLEAMMLAAQKGGMTVISGNSHKFTPHGTTAFVMLAESHISIHTWPEYGYAALDIYTCGKNPESVLEELQKLLPISEIKKVVLDRGPH